MKLLLSWLFDHIEADWHAISVPDMVNLFNKSTAEIESVSRLTLNANDFALGCINQNNSQEIILHVPEWSQDLSLPLRADAQLNSWYMVKKEKNSYAWATAADFGSGKQALLGALHVAPEDRLGTWKNRIAWDDYILILDNKSINHRPDMWGHRGVAREIAALLKLSLKPIAEFLAVPDSQHTSTDTAFEVVLADTHLCKRYVGIFIGDIQPHAAALEIAIRLCQVDSRSHNFIIDATNYIQQDLGQPMHAFDADRLAQKKITVGYPSAPQDVTLLDGSNVSVDMQDGVIQTGPKIIALAGIMGTQNSAVVDTTQSIFLEAATFDAAAVRKSSLRLKKRTDSSARFEKNLDPSLALQAIQRFIFLLDRYQYQYCASMPIEKGTIRAPMVITLSHAVIEKQLGVSLEVPFILDTLKRLECTVVSVDSAYQITIPSFRATKDISIAQDIVEEIGRFYGYDALTPQLPTRLTKFFDLAPVMRRRSIKKLLAYGWDMQEVYTYAFFDESFLQQLNWQPGQALQVKEAVSQNWQRLITTLIPNLLKVVAVHEATHETLSFFEWASTWHEKREQMSLSGIWYSKKNSLDFYDYKQHFAQLEQLIGGSIEWQPVSSAQLPAWYLPYQTAQLLIDGKQLGLAGKINPSFIAGVMQVDAFIFELDAHLLMQYKPALKAYKAVSKFPSITRDVSMLIEQSITVATLVKALQEIDKRISSITLIDFFEKPEWGTKKSLTFRITLNDAHATMTSQHADAIMQQIYTLLHAYHAVIR